MAPLRIELCNVQGRSSLHVHGQVLDIEHRSQGRFSSDPMDAIVRWEELCTWAKLLQPEMGDAPLDVQTLGPCVPRPRRA